MDPKIFSHEAHLRLAWINVIKYGAKTAIENVQSQLMAFVNAVGETDKYNRTLTIAATKIVNHHIQRSKSDNFSDFIAEFPKLTKGFRELVRAHYSVDIFTSAEAKLQWLEPDLLPFDE